MKKIILTIFILLLFLPAEGSAAGIITDTNGYPGWMPVIYANAGDVYDLDLTRFMDVTPGMSITSSGVFDVPFDSAKKNLSIKIKEPQVGLFDLPLTIKSNDISKKIFLTLVAIKRHHRLFKYKANKPAKKVVLCGSFNGWNQGANPLQDDDGDGTWETTVAIDTAYKRDGDFIYVNRYEERIQPLFHRKGCRHELYPGKNACFLPENSRKFSG